MTLKIEIEVPFGEVANGAAAQYLRRALSALGYEKAVMAAMSDAAISGTGMTKTSVSDDGKIEVEHVPAEEMRADEPTRERGQPSPGKARRTKAEIAEDEAADAADAAQSNISSGAEDRVDPENADDAATEAADAADETAEADAGRDDEKTLTVDDVKALAVEYQEKYGFEAVQEDGAKIFVEAVGAPPAGEPFWKFSILPTDQASLQKLAAIWRKAIDLNPLKRAVKQAG